jgi:hypothetical protein
LVVSSAHLEDGTTLTDEGLLLGKMDFGELVVSSAHLEDGTTLTDEGLLLGKMDFGSFVHVRPG